MDLFGDPTRLESTEQFAFRVGAVGLTCRSVEPDAVSRGLQELPRGHSSKVWAASLFRECGLSVPDGHHTSALLAANTERLVTDLFVIHVVAGRAGFAGKLHQNSSLRLSMGDATVRGPMREQENGRWRLHPSKERARGEF